MASTMQSVDRRRRRRGLLVVSIFAAVVAVDRWLTCRGLEDVGGSDCQSKTKNAGLLQGPSSSAKDGDCYEGTPGSFIEGNRMLGQQAEGSLGHTVDRGMRHEVEGVLGDSKHSEDPNLWRIMRGRDGEDENGKEDGFGRMGGENGEGVGTISEKGSEDVMTTTAAEAAIMFGSNAAGQPLGGDGAKGRPSLFAAAKSTAMLWVALTLSVLSLRLFLHPATGGLGWEYREQILHGRSAIRVMPL